MAIFKKFSAFRSPSSGDWWFQDPDLPHTYTANTKQELLDRIVKFRSQNELPEIEMLSAVVENFMCGQRQYVGSCERVKMQRSFYSFLKGGIALLRNVLVKDTVSQALADKRSEKCMTCPHNVFPNKGQFVKYADRLAEDAVPGKKSLRHNQLGNCSVCSCPLRVKVWIKGPFDLEEEEKVAMKKVGCWQILGTDEF